MTPNSIHLSIGEARAWDEDHKSDYLPLTEGALNQLPTKHRRGWTPAPDPATQLRRYEPPAKHGRDYEALTRAALKRPVGYWEDAPYQPPFKESPLLDFVEPSPASKELRAAYEHARLLAEAANKMMATPPRGDDGVWYDWHGCVFRCHGGRVTQLCIRGFVYPREELTQETLIASHGERLVKLDAPPINWLEQNGHAKVAAELRLAGKASCGEDGVSIALTENSDHFIVHLEARNGDTWNFRFALDGKSEGGGGKTANFEAMRKKAHDFMATLVLKRKPAQVGRAWKCEGPDACYSWRAIKIGNRWFETTGSGWTEGAPNEFCEVEHNHSDDRSHYVELHGPEAESVIAECRKAMGL